MTSPFYRCLCDVKRFLIQMEEKNGPLRDLPIISKLDQIAPTSDQASAHRSGVVLKSDTHLELGSPACGSCAMILYDNQPTQQRDHRITLIGPDVGETSATSLPFGHIIIIRGVALTDEDYYEILQQRVLSFSLDGYMVKSTAEQIWSRVSHEAARKGFCFAALGSVLIQRIKNLQPKIKTVEIVFVTSSSEDVVKLGDIAQHAWETAEAIKKTIWQKRGIDILACAPGAHCGACDDEATCLEIKKIGALRKQSTIGGGDLR